MVWVLAVSRVLGQTGKGNDRNRLNHSKMQMHLHQNPPPQSSTMAAAAFHSSVESQRKAHQGHGRASRHAMAVFRHRRQRFRDGGSAASSIAVLLEHALVTTTPGICTWAAVPGHVTAPREHYEDHEECNERDETGREDPAAPWSFLGLQPNCTISEK